MGHPERREAWNSPEVAAAEPKAMDVTPYQETATALAMAIQVNLQYHYNRLQIGDLGNLAHAYLDLLTRVPPGDD